MRSLRQLNDEDDGYLIELYRQDRNKNKAAGEILIKRHRKDLIKFIQKYNEGNKIADHEDIFHQTWLKFTEKLMEGRFRRKNLPGYLKEIARNKIRDCFRKQKITNKYFVNIYGNPDTAETKDSFHGTWLDRVDVSNPEKELLMSELANKLQKAIRGLPVAQREIWLLRTEWSAQRLTGPIAWQQIAEMNKISVEEAKRSFSAVCDNLVATQQVRDFIEKQTEVGSLEAVSSSGTPDEETAHSVPVMPGAIDTEELLFFDHWTQALGSDQDVSFVSMNHAKRVGMDVSVLWKTFESARDKLLKFKSVFESIRREMADALKALVAGTGDFNRSLDLHVNNVPPRLTALERLIFMLRTESLRPNTEDQRSYEYLADLFGENDKTLRSRYSKARQKLEEQVYN